MTDIPGYTLGTDVVLASPVTPADFAAMRETALFGDEDVRFLKMSAAVLEDQIVDGMASAWQKSVLLQLALWSHPYIKDGDW